MKIKLIKCLYFIYNFLRAQSNFEKVFDTILLLVGGIFISKFIDSKHDFNDVYSAIFCIIMLFLLAAALKKFIKSVLKNSGGWKELNPNQYFDTTEKSIVKIYDNLGLIGDSYPATSKESSKILDLYQAAYKNTIWENRKVTKEYIDSLINKNSLSYLMISDVIFELNKPLTFKPNNIPGVSEREIDGKRVPIGFTHIAPVNQHNFNKFKEGYLEDEAFSSDHILGLPLAHQNDKVEALIIFSIVVGEKLQARKLGFGFYDDYVAKILTNAIAYHLKSYLKDYELISIPVIFQTLATEVEDAFKNSTAFKITKSKYGFSIMTFDLSSTPSKSVKSP